MYESVCEISVHNVPDTLMPTCRSVHVNVNTRTVAIVREKKREPWIRNALPTMEHSLADLNRKCRNLNSRESTTLDVLQNKIKNIRNMTLLSIVCCVVDLDE